MVDIVGLYNSLLNASYGGVPFFMLPADREVGRRMQEFLYPGLDAPSYQDLGLHNGRINVQGFLVGEDYIAQSQQLIAAFETPGPMTLNHPWLGNILVVQDREQKPKVSFSDKELRVCRFQAVFKLFTPPPQSVVDTLTALVEKVRAVTANAENWLAAQLAPVAGALGAFSYAQGWMAGLSTQFGALVATGSSGAIIGPAAAAAIATLKTPVTVVNVAWATATAGFLAGVPGAIADSCTPPLPSAVAPGGATTAAAAADPADATAMLISSMAIITPGLSAPPPGPQLAMGMLALIAANAAQAASNIDYSSQKDAQAQAVVMNAVFDTAINAAAVQAASTPQLAQPVWTNLLDLKAAFAADINAQIGRLPAVVNITVANTIPAWLLAQYISGDTPGQVFATWRDIVARNKIKNPGAVPPGNYEALAS
jgi:prophage DNA circulation protein